MTALADLIGPHVIVDLAVEDDGTEEWNYVGGGARPGQVADLADGYLDAEPLAW